MKKAFLIFLSCTWGAPMTLIGLFATLGLLIAGHRPHKYGIGWYFVVGDGWGGANLGLTTILCKTSAQGTHTLNHETGHALQNCVFGVLMPFLVCIPSAVRYWWRIYQKRKGSTILAEYDAVWFEGQATRWGNAYGKQKDFVDRAEVIKTIKVYGYDAIAQGRHELDVVDDLIEIVKRVEEIK